MTQWSRPFKSFREEKRKGMLIDNISGPGSKVSRLYAAKTESGKIKQNATTDKTEQAERSI